MKVLVVSSSRADFGLLLPVIRELNSDSFFDISVCEIGSHISENLMNLEILNEAGVAELGISFNFPSIDSAEGKAITSAEILKTLTSHFSQTTYDAIMILGDRFETLAIAYAATLSNLPIIHLVGGDLTLGSIDDSYRHAITKLSKIHFVTNADSLNRVLQLGEEGEFVYLSGSPGLDSLTNISFLSRTELETLLSVELKSNIILVTFHPDSIHPAQVEEQVAKVVEALKNFQEVATIIITGANFDYGYSTVNEIFQNYASQNPRSVKFIANLGSRNYFSIMRIASVMVGNSSSGYYEAASFGLPVVDIGERQKGRIPHNLLTNVQIEVNSISSGIEASLNKPKTPIKNPYWDGNSSEKIRDFLKNLPLGKLHSPKGFKTIAPRG